MEFILKEFREVARLISLEGLTYGYTGNLSRLWGNRLFITRTGSNLLNLTDEDIIAIPFQGSSLLEERASSERNVHRRVLKETGKKAVAHLHAVYTIKLSFLSDSILPIDSEGKAILGEVPVLNVEKASASEELAEKLSEALKNKDVAVVKSHGVFAVGENLIEAYEKVAILENSCKILWGLKYGGES
ncbi:class II aldolase/adducin family protein [Aquifex sp.]